MMKDSKRRPSREEILTPYLSPCEGRPRGGLHAASGLGSQKTDANGQEQEVGLLSAGDYIGGPTKKTSLIERSVTLLLASGSRAGRAIVTEQRHMATVLAVGELVTLSMSKQARILWSPPFFRVPVCSFEQFLEAFEQAGLKARLHFPKRPAIEVGGTGEERRAQWASLNSGKREPWP